jgi:hypothetical protein
MNTTSQAELFFKSIPESEAKGFRLLEKLAQPESQSEENEWRDFKEAKPLTCPPDSATPPEQRKKNDQEIKKLWSENIGAFANSGGGVLIWGIKAPKKLAEGTSLAADAEALACRLQELANDSVDPPVLRIQVRAFRRSKSSPEGFVACFIPPSRHAPHRSKFAVREYYIRAQDGNINCPTAILRRLFYPTSAAKLIPIVKIRAAKGGGDYLHIQGSIEILNQGNATASEVFIIYEGALDLRVTPNDWQTSPRNPKHYWSQRSIHPGQTLSLAHNITSAYTPQDWPIGSEPIKFKICLYARDCTPSCRAFEVSWSDLQSAHDSGAATITPKGFDLPLD